MVMEPNSGNLQYIPNPHAAKVLKWLALLVQKYKCWRTRKNAKDSKGLSKMQQLWMFNMGYEVRVLV